MISASALRAPTSIVILLTAFAAPLAAQPRDARNAALRYWMAFAVMQDPPADRATTDLLESVSAGKTPWDEAHLGSILDANQEAIQGMRRASTLSDCDWGLEYELGPSAPVPHLAKARVLARLSALAGTRLAAQGQTAEAVETWLAGVRFSQHIAQGGSLISLLTARAALGASLRPLGQSSLRAAADESLGKRIDAVLRALPPAAFDWAEAMRREQSALEIAVQQLSSAPDPGARYQDMMGAPPPEGFSRPASSDVAAFRRFMASLIEAFRLPPEVTAQRLAGLEDSRKTVHVFFQETLPSLSRINGVRAELQAELQQVLGAVSTPAIR